MSKISEEKTKIETIKDNSLSSKITNLRDILNDGWKPNYFIQTSDLYFKSEEAREEFQKLISENEIIEYLNF